MGLCRKAFRSACLNEARSLASKAGIMETLGWRVTPPAQCCQQTTRSLPSTPLPSITQRGSTFPWTHTPPRLSPPCTVLPPASTPATWPPHPLGRAPRRWSIHGLSTIAASPQPIPPERWGALPVPPLSRTPHSRRLSTVVRAAGKGVDDSSVASIAAEKSSTRTGESGGDGSKKAGERRDTDEVVEDAALPKGGMERTPSGLLRLVPEAARPIPQQLGVLVTTWRRRAVSYARESILLIYSALIDNTLVVVLERLKVDRLLRKAQPWLERASARVFGSYHEMADGRRVPLSLVNSTAPDFSVPTSYTPAELPFGLPRGSGYDANVAHFMALCMKVVYEEEEVIQDLGERVWGLNYHGYFSTQTTAASLYDVENSNTADFIPRTRACMLSSRHGLVIAFRGSEPLNLINLRSSGKITMRPRFEMGRLHDGFHAALFYSDSEAGSLYTQIVESLIADDSTKGLPIFLSGHSLGGALVQVFAAALARKHPEISSRVSGLYTFGMPRVGDYAFAAAMEQHYPDCAFRITHAADIIPLVPPKFLEYYHFGQEHYLTSLGREVVGDAAVRRARAVEAVGFLPLYLWKLGAGLVLNPKEGSLRTIFRIFMLVLLPGLNDHFPADYVYRLERLLKKP